MSPKRSTGPCDPKECRDARAGSSATASPEEILRTNPDFFRANLERLSPEGEPALCAAEQLKLGAVLRSRARCERGAKRIKTCTQAISAFEAALRFYCNFSPAATSGGERRHGAVAADLARPESSSMSEGVDLILELISHPMLDDVAALECAADLFEPDCTNSARMTDFEKWLASIINLGCTLTLLGKLKGAQGDISELERAIDMYHELLADPALRERPNEVALICINLAEALSSMAETSIGETQEQYLDSAADSLARALKHVAPANYAPLLEPGPIAFM